MNKEYKIKLDLNKKLYNKKMTFNQFDENVNDFYIEVTKNNEVVKDLNKSIVTLVAIKPNGTVDAQFIEVKEGQIYADLKPSMCDLVGNYQAKAMIVLEGEIVTTDTINYSVNEDKIISRLNEDVVSDERFALFTDALARLSDIEASEEQRVINEAERILSEENRKIEEAKRVEAELIRQHEEADRAKYDATRESNENIRKQNEEARISSENVRLENEANRIEQETNRVKAEQLRKDNYNFMTEDEERRRLEANAHKEAEVLRVQAETNRVNEEAKRRTTEQARVSAENTRVSNENTRKANEVARQNNETQRIEAETQRQNRYNSFISDAEANANNFENYTNTAKVKEEERKSNELDRKSQEDRRVSNEAERISNENTRKSNENARIESEKQRVDAENLRKEKIIEIQSDYDSLKKVIIDENASVNLQNQINQTNSQLEHKANKNEVRKNTVLIELSDLSQNVKETMTGGSVAVVGKNSILNENITRNAVHYENTNFISIGENLFDYTTVTPDKYLSGGNAVYNGAGWSVSDFIPVLGDSQYYARKTDYSYFYDEDKNVISQISENPFTTPSNCRYVRFSIQNNSNTFYMNEGNVDKGYSEFGYRVKRELPVQKIANNAIDGIHVKDGSLDIEKLSFINKPTNLLNSNYVKINTSIDIYGGHEIASSNYFSSNFIQVDPNTSYNISPIDSNFSIIYLYDENKRYLTYKYNTSGLIVTNENAVYIRIVVYGKDRFNKMCVIKSDKLEPYTSGTPTIKIENIPIEDIKIALSDRMTKNLFNENEVIYDKYLSGGIVVDNSNNWKVSGLIEVDSNESYILSQNFSKLSIQYSYFYDEDKNVISQISENPFTTPSNCRYVRFSIQNSVEDLILEKGDDIGYFIPYGYESDYRHILNSKWLNKKLACIGDSITASSAYQLKLAKALGMVRVCDNGVSGTTVSMIRDNAMSSDDRINIIPTDVDVITIMGGSNDWGAYNIEVGNIYDCEMGNINETESTLTFMGAYQLMLNKLYKRIPNARIIIMEQPFRANMTPTQEGKVLDDFRKATREIAYKYGYPVIKTYQNAGINQLNYETFLRDVVHPNEVGCDRLAEVMISEFSNF